MKTQQSFEILYGIHPVGEALTAKKRNLVELYVSNQKTSGQYQHLIERAQHANIPVSYLSIDQLNTLCKNASHQGVCLRSGCFPCISLENLLSHVNTSSSSPLLLILDSIQDPHNVGALIRTAVSVGVTGILLPKDRSASLTPTVSKTSAGALEHATVVQVTNLVQAIKQLKKQGIWIAGMDKASQLSIYSCKFTDPVALVIGGEQNGLRMLVKKHCDFLLSIPQLGPVESLNASVAGAIVLYEAYRQRFVG
ncbi:MAG: 23S rRNA (guanosine(2251)-2'-O)-methyltransferase RlmB [Desulfobacterales bacterium]|nr:23S rRNA (guanosine(2251)-2'-O)-methyltransferase RlmB [Desulfobacterales bacterium]